MKTAAILSALALSLAPTLSFAMCGGESARPTTAMTCAEGQVLDTATNRCVDEATTS